MKPDVAEVELEGVLRRVEFAGAKAHVSVGEEITVVAAIGDRERIRNLRLEGTPGVDRVVPILKPYALASTQYTRGRSTAVEIAGRKIGRGHFAVIAGPCTVESRETLLETAGAVERAGADLLRGGAYKPRTSPYAFQGLGRAGLEMLREARDASGLPVVTEVLDVRDLEAVLEVADVVQIGARNMQNYALLAEVGRSDAAVLLKRGLSATLEELLLAAEYILAEGNERVVLCERGVRSFEPSYRFMLDVSAVPALKELTHLPVIVDPSHAAGKRQLVEPLSLAAAAAGADGVIVEVHPRPDEAVCDAQQALLVADFDRYVRRLRQAAAIAADAGAEAIAPTEVATSNGAGEVEDRELSSATADVAVLPTA
jgi:3-deoxy-7-phosphoheptulonate synthase